MVTGPNSSERRIIEQIDSRLRMLEKNMNIAQLKFAQAYAKTGKLGPAARQAGSTAKRPDAIGHQYLKEEVVQEYVDLMRQKMADIAALKNTEVIEMFRDIYREAMVDRAFKEANTAAEKLGEILGILGSRSTPVKEGTEGNRIGGDSEPKKESSEEDSFEDLKSNLADILKSKN